MDRIRNTIAEWIAPHTNGMSADDVRAQFARPKKAEWGDIALPCFKLPVGDLKKPNEKADHLAKTLPAHELVEGAVAEGPYLNITLSASAMAAQIIPGLDELAANGYRLPDGEGKVLTMDYSSPNVAKEFSLGHLRSTMLGHSLIQLYTSCGWKTVGINHLGDWGHQFGVVITAWQEEGDEKALEADPIPYLQAIYQKYSLREKAEGLKKAGKPPMKDTGGDDYVADPLLPDDPQSVTARARKTDDALQAGDKKIRALWKRFLDLSIAALKLTYADLGVNFDAWTGESFFEDKMEPIVAELRKKKLLTESQGAQVVEMGEDKAPCIVLKSGGGTTYATRDLAAATYRHNEYHFDRNVYVVDARQSEHFANVFEVLKRAGHEWAERCQHVPFGAVRIKGQVMSTRAGNVILVEDYIAKNQERVLEIMREKNPGLENDLGPDDYQATARAVAKAAILFEMLKVDRTNDVNYASEEAVNFDGETGPRVQMTYAKTGSVLRNYETTFGKPHDPAAMDFSHYTTVWERNLLRLLGDYQSTVRAALAEHQPYLVARYMLEIADWLNLYWKNVLFLDTDNPAAADSRVSLLSRMRGVIRQCLHLLGLEAPERM
ncbi:MAG: arginine--tRNA ligase [Planctomycetota bacterium]